MSPERRPDPACQKSHLPRFDVGRWSPVKRAVDKDSECVAILRTSHITGESLPRDAGIQGARGGYTPCACRIISAARSPMIAQGAWVLPVVTRGMIEPSATRRPATP